MGLVYIHYSQIILSCWSKLRVIRLFQFMWLPPRNCFPILIIYLRAILSGTCSLQSGYSLTTPVQAILREEMQQKRRSQSQQFLDPISASRTPNAAHEPVFKPRYSTHQFACEFVNIYYHFWLLWTHQAAMVVFLRDVMCNCMITRITSRLTSLPCFMDLVFIVQ